MGGKRRERKRGKQRSLRGGGVVVAGLTETVDRCRSSRRRPAPCSAPASCRRGRLRLLSRRVVRLHGNTSDLRSWRTGGVTGRGLPLHPSFSLPHSPSSLPRGGELKKGGKPQVGWCGAARVSRFPLGSQSRRRRGKLVAGASQFEETPGRRRG
jgi:hypothetical protein